MNPWQGQAEHPTPVAAFGRAIRKRCPRCGGGDLFERRLKMRARCPRCDLLLEREEGAFLGSMSINYAVTGSIGLVYLIAMLIFERSAPTWLLVSGGLAILLAVPLLFYPTSKTLWAALDLLAFRLEHDNDQGSDHLPS